MEHVAMQLVFPLQQAMTNWMLCLYTEQSSEINQQMRVLLHCGLNFKMITGYINYSTLPVCMIWCVQSFDNYMLETLMPDPSVWYLSLIRIVRGRTKVVGNRGNYGLKILKLCLHFYWICLIPDYICVGLCRRTFNAYTRAIWFKCSRRSNSLDSSKWIWPTNLQCSYWTNCC